MSLVVMGISILGSGAAMSVPITLLRAFSAIHFGGDIKNSNTFMISSAASLMYTGVLCVTSGLVSGFMTAAYDWGWASGGFTGPAAVATCALVANYYHPPAFFPCLLVGFVCSVKALTLEMNDSIPRAMGRFFFDIPREVFNLVTCGVLSSSQRGAR